MVVDDLLDALLDPSPTFAFGRRWLERNVPPEPARLTIVHTDIRTGNIIVGDDGLRAILDWETARIGDPMEDLAWPCQRMWRFREDARTVGGLGGGGGVPRCLRRRRRRLGRRRASHGGGYSARCSWGLGLAGQARGHLDGSFPSIVMAASGRRVPELEYDTLLLLRPRVIQALSTAARCSGDIGLTASRNVTPDARAARGNSQS